MKAAAEEDGMGNTKVTHRALLEWLRASKENCMSLAQQKQGDDKAGWLEDAAYFEAAIICATETPKKMRERDMGAFNAGYDAAIAHTRANTPEQMRERCFHDFLRLIQACMRFMDQEEEGVLQRFRGLVEQHGIPGLGTGTCDCGADDCPYKTASVPCDCGLPDCSDPRSTKGVKA